MARDDLATGNASKEHEDLGYAAEDSGVRVAFHWFARFADHVLFTDPPLGRVDDRTGRLAFNTTLTDLLHSIGTEADSPDSIVVLGSQIFDILKAPLADYASNLALLIQHVIPKVTHLPLPEHLHRALSCTRLACDACSIRRAQRAHDEAGEGRPVACFCPRGCFV